MMRIGMLTSGGDCQALNAAMRGVVKCIAHSGEEVEFYGFDFVISQVYQRYVYIVRISILVFITFIPYLDIEFVYDFKYSRIVNIHIRFPLNQLSSYPFNFHISQYLCHWFFYCFIPVRV